MVSREELYELVWSIPVIKAAKKYSVSGSYLARVCTALRVPRPPLGYWAKLEVGKAPMRPALPEALPGDQLFWSQEGDPPAPAVSAVTATSAPAQPRVRRVVTGIHDLIQGAKQHYERGYKVEEGQLLRPYKRKLVDVFVVYLAGHGVALKDLYAYPAAEARTLDLSDPAVRAQTAVSSDELVEWIKKVPAQHQLMILDTCAAGAAAVKLAEKRDFSGDQVRALDQLKDRTGFYVLMGSAADAVSYESSRYGQGLLTYALLKGMKGAALKNDVDVDVSKLLQFAVDDVPGLARGIGGVQRPQIIAPTGGASFDVGQLQPEDQSQIQLATEKPIFLRPQLVNAEGPDDLELGAAVRRELREETYISTRSGQSVADAIFVDADEMPGAIGVSGTYLVEEKKITAQIWLAREKQKTHVVVEGWVDDIPALAAKIAKAVLNAGKAM